MLVERDADADFVKVLDFGIAKRRDVEVGGPGSSWSALTRLGMVIGTPEYMAPEQALGQTVDGRADIYSLGVIAFEMLTGTRPFENQNPAAWMAMHVTANVPEMASVAEGLDVPPSAEALVRRMLAKEPSQALRRREGARRLRDRRDAGPGRRRQNRPRARRWRARPA